MQTRTPTARLVGLKVENYQRIEHAELGFGDTDPPLVVISGPNEAGKTTLIDAVWDALGGQKPRDPVHWGAGGARVEVVLDVLYPNGERDTLTATRIWTKDEDGKVNSRLKVVSEAGGGKVSSPQGVLDTLLNSIAFDPLQWVALGHGGVPQRRAQAKALMDCLRITASEDLVALANTYLAPIGVDVTTEDDAFDVTKLVDDRVRGVRHERKQALGGVESELEVIGPVEEVERADIGMLLRELETLTERKQQRLDLASEIGGMAEKAEDLQRRAREWSAKADEARRHLAGLEVATDGAIEVARAALSGATETNAQADAWARRQKLEAVREGRQAAVDVLEADVLRIGELRDDVLAKANLPAGLTFDDEGLLRYKGAPFPDQASGEEQITVGVEVAASTNPGLKLLRIRDGNRLDREHWDGLQAILKERGYTALVELVDDTGKVGIVIEGGKVVHDAR